MDELYEAIMTKDVQEIQKVVDKQIKEAPSKRVGKTIINNFKCDARHLQDTGEIRYSNDVNGLNPLMFILWSYSILSDSSEAISSDIIPMCKIFVEIHHDPNNLLVRDQWGGVGNKYTPYSFVTDQLIDKEATTSKEKNILKNLLKYFDSKIDHFAPAAFKKKKLSKKKKKNKSSKKKRKIKRNPQKIYMK